MSEHLMRVGVIIENTKRQPRWLVELIDSLAAEEYVNELILLTLDPKRRRGSGGYYRLKDRLSLIVSYVYAAFSNTGVGLIQITRHIEGCALKLLFKVRSSPYIESYLCRVEEDYDLPEFIRTIPVLTEWNSGRNQINENSLDQILEEQLSIIVQGTRCGDYAIEQLSSFATQNVLVFQSAGQNVHDCKHIGFWEATLGNNLVEINVRLGFDSLDLLERRSYIKTTPSMWLNHAKLLAAAPEALLKAFRILSMPTLSASYSERSVQATTPSQDKYKNRPSAKWLCHYLLKASWWIICSFVSQIASITYKRRRNRQKWKLAYGRISEPISQWLTIRNDDCHWNGDPFLFFGNDKYIIFERYSESSSKGEIAYAQIRDPVKTKTNELQIQSKTLLSKSYHLSYPFVFRDRDGRNYLIPESLQNGTIDLYELIENEGTLEVYFRRTILSISAVDTTIIFLDNMYYLFTNTEYLGAFGSSLSVFYSDSLLKGQFAPHRLNPIIIDPRYSRNAGRITCSDGDIIRPAQQNITRYGEKLHFLNIDVSPELFSWNVVDSLNPPETYWGLHHFDSQSDWGVIDLSF